MVYKTSCSVACFKLHKESCIPLPSASDDTPSSSTLPSPAAPPTQSSSTRHEEKDDSVKRVVITDAQMTAVLTNPKVSHWLESQRLKDAITRIDSSADRVHMLENHLQDPEFAQFVQDCLDAYNQP
jgi:predicted AlkP superfamily phosphohydrolase/phosphomutase